MKLKTVVIALGGNAFLRPRRKMTMQEQFEAARHAMDHIAPVAKKHRLVITHGNGPQVGNILIRTEEALGKAYNIPLEVAVAESEGELGYVIEQTLYNEFTEQKINKPIATLLTQVLVDAKDRSFKKPTKPVGPFYSKSFADKLKKKNIPVVLQKGRGWRRVVPSPKPKKIIGAETIKRLLGQNIVLVAAGGGGIPVIRKRGRLQGVEAVIDKDFASACLAKAIKAEVLVNVTGVEKVALNYNTEEQKDLKKINILQAKKYLREGHFPPGSMGPKIEAAIQFLKSGGKKVIITDIPNISKAIAGKAGTEIRK